MNAISRTIRPSRYCNLQCFGTARHECGHNTVMPDILVSKNNTTATLVMVVELFLLCVVSQAVDIYQNKCHYLGGNLKHSEVNASYNHYVSLALIIEAY